MAQTHICIQCKIYEYVCVFLNDNFYMFRYMFIMICILHDISWKDYIWSTICYIYLNYWYIIHIHPILKYISVNDLHNKRNGSALRGLSRVSVIRWTILRRSRDQGWFCASINDVDRCKGYRICIYTISTYNIERDIHSVYICIYIYIRYSDAIQVCV